MVMKHTMDVQFVNVNSHKVRSSQHNLKNDISNLTNRRISDKAIKLMAAIILLSFNKDHICNCYGLDTEQ